MQENIELNRSDKIKLKMISAQRVIHMKDMLISIMAQNSGQPYDKVKEDCERDHFLTAQEALEYGLIDEIIGDKEK